MGSSKQNLSTAGTVLGVIGFNVVMLLLLEVPLIGYATNPDGTAAAVARFNGWLSRNGGASRPDRQRRHRDPADRTRDHQLVSRAIDARLLKYARATRPFLIALIVVGTAGAVLIVVQAWLLADIIAAAFAGGKGIAALRLPFMVLLAVVVARATLGWGREVMADRASARVKAQLRDALLEHVAALGPGRAADRWTGQIAVLTTRGIDALDGYFSLYLPQLFLAGIVPVAVLAAIGAQDWISALIIAGTLPLIPLFMVLVGAATRERMEHQLRSLQQLAGHFLDVVAGLPTLKVFGRAKAQIGAVGAVTDRYRVATMSTLRITFLSSLILELVATLSVALVAVEIGLRLMGGHLGLRTALMVLVLAPEAYLPLRQLGANYHASAEGVAAARQIFDVLEMPLPAHGRGSRRSGPGGEQHRDRGAPGPVSGTRPTRARRDLDDDRARGGAGDHRTQRLRQVDAPRGHARLPVAADGVGARRRRGSGRAGPRCLARAGVVDAAATTSVCGIDRRQHSPRAPRRDASPRSPRRSPPPACARWWRANRPGWRRCSATTAPACPWASVSGSRSRAPFCARRPLLLLDEPTANLDGETEAEVLAALRRLVRGPYRPAGRAPAGPGGAGRPSAGARRGAGGGVTSATGHPARSDEMAGPQAPVLATLALALTRPVAGRLALATLLGAGALGAGIGLIATSAWLISRASQRPPESALAVAIVAVQFFALSRGLFRYEQRLIGHDSAFRSLAALRTRSYERLETLAPAGLAAFRSGDLLARVVHDIDSLQDVLLRVIPAFAIALIVGAGTVWLVWWILPAAGLILLATLVLAATALTWLTGRLARRSEAERAAARGELTAAVVDLLHGAPELTAYGAVGAQRSAHRGQRGPARPRRVQRRAHGGRRSGNRGPALRARHVGRTPGRRRRGARRGPRWRAPGGHRAGATGRVRARRRPADSGADAATGSSLHRADDRGPGGRPAGQRT